MLPHFWLALLITALAGLATTIGSVIALFYRQPGPRYMAFTLGFSAGVMVLISFIELLPQGIEAIGFLSGHIAFFSGMLIMLIIDVKVSHSYILENHHLGNKENAHLQKASLLVASGIAIHNFPEGMVAFAGTLNDVHLGFILALAIAIHNIPEGIAVAVPIFAATRSRKRAFFWSFLSGLSEPLGALITGLLLYPFLSPALLGWLLSMVGGFMVYISFDELLPVANSYGKEHYSIAGLMVGFLIMMLSLYMLK
jgi:ZIP family zinc transporter